MKVLATFRRGRVVHGRESVRGPRARVWRVAAAAVLLVGLPGLSLGVTAGSATAAAPGTVTIYTGIGSSGAYAIAAGPDSAMWFTNLNERSIGRISTTGTVTNFAGSAEPYGIAAGPDGALWFTNYGARSIGRISTTGMITTYTDPAIVGPVGIAAGPDRAMWFTNGDSIGRISTTGTITTYTGTGISFAQWIAAGPDGAMWFTNNIGASIGRISMSGTVTNYDDVSINLPSGIAAGPDGALWFTNGYDSSIGRISTTGTITNYTGTGILFPAGIAAGPDGALWFANHGNDSIGRISTTGTVTNYTGTGIDSPAGIAAGPDGGMWFTNGNDSIGRIEPGEPTPVVRPGGASVVEGNSGTVDLQVPVTLSIPSSQTVTVQWTTGSTTSANPLVADPATDFTGVSGTVTFAPGETAKTVSISVNGDVLVEPDEWIVVSFSHPTNAQMGGFYGLGFGKITNDDHATVLPGGASVVEGNAGTVELQVPVTLSNPSTQTVTATWSTGPAGAGVRADPANDFTAASGTVTFAPGETAKTVSISVNGDTDVEANEWITLSFKNPTNANMGGFYGLGFGVIVNDD